VSDPSETARGRNEAVELSPLGRTAARRVAESKATIPHLYLESEVDMTRSARLLGDLAGTDESSAPTANDAVIGACAQALRDHPRLNGSYRDGELELHSRINVGFAAQAEDAFVLPTVFDADAKGLAEIAKETRNLASRARDGSLTAPELAGGTFTVSSLGAQGISSFHPVINPPQAAILAVGEVKATPVVTDDGSIEPRQIMRVTLACDHRIVGVADGAAFLARVRELLEEAKWRE
jgi:pyruvate dehydrogenase E2 component (dihydrolipoamide acetyltransferase)